MALSPPQWLMSTKEEDVVNTCFSCHFQLDKWALINQGVLDSLLETLGNLKGAAQILNWSYTYSKCCNTLTVMLLKEMTLCKTHLNNFSQLQGHGISTKAFINYSSSYLGHHFGHFKAVVRSYKRSSLYVQSMNLAMQYVKHLSRWKKGVTALLEKCQKTTWAMPPGSWF